jgi:uncharacterized integral membrane protein (TIGR00698 family)
MFRDTDTDADSAHEMFRSFDFMEGLPAPEPQRPRTFVALARAIYPGLAAAGVAGLAASWLSQHYGAPVMLFALLLGMAFHFLHEEGRCVPGIEFASKAVLRLGVALLGARITIDQILSLGVAPIAMVVGGIASTLLAGLLLARMMGLSRGFGLLSGGSVGICGASAALAIASVLPRTRETERDLILVVVVVTTLSTIAMVLYPMVVTALGFTSTQAGLFLGASIHDVAQVVGAGYMISPETGDTATYVKLLRVAMLLLVVPAVALAMMRSGAGGGARAQIPWFLVGFAALVGINSLGWLPPPAAAAATDVSRACLVIAIAALGMKTSFRFLLQAGWRPVAAMAAETAWLAALALAVVAWTT